MEIKSIHLRFTDRVFKQLKKKKGEMTWEEYFMTLAEIK